MHPDPVTGALTKGIARARWNHDQIIDMMIADPQLTQNKIAEIFGYTQGWVSQMINSDAFQARLSARRKEVVDPELQSAVKDRIEAAAAAAYDQIIERLTHPALPASDDFVLQAAKIAGTALGYGARPQGEKGPTGPAVVINLPGKLSQEEWAQRYARGPSQPVTDVVPLDPPTPGDQK